MEVVQVITDELRKRLGLTLFGYDTVVQENTGVLVSQAPLQRSCKFRVTTRTFLSAIFITSCKAHLHGITSELIHTCQHLL